MNDDTISGGNDNSTPASEPTTNAPVPENNTPQDIPASVEPSAAPPSSPVPKIAQPEPTKLALEFTGSLQKTVEVSGETSLRTALADTGLAVENFTFRNGRGHLVSLDKPLSETSNHKINVMPKADGG